MREAYLSLELPLVKNLHGDDGRILDGAGVSMGWADGES